MNRLDQINNQFPTGKTFVSDEKIKVDDKVYPEVVDHHKAKGVKTDYYNLQGWGFADSGFKYDKKEKGIRITGNRYMFGGQILPGFLPFLQTSLSLDVEHEAPKVPLSEFQVTPPTLNHAFIEELGDQNFSRRSFSQVERIHHSHGQTFQEINALRAGKLEKYCDMVVYPMSTEHCQNLVALANKHNVVIVPYGGGTTVSQSLKLPNEEQRMIVSCDMTRMNAVKWVDKENGMACVQAGIFGSDLERDLKQYGVISGHEPDSMEFSTLGGWISTRASGMKKNTYGNIEDIVQNITLVTSKGVYQKLSAWPRISNGPDLNHLVMGSEGNFGIVTEAIIKVKPLPEVRIFESVLFYDWEDGVQFMHAVSKMKLYPTSCRLVDNEQFKFGSTMKPAAESAWTEMVEKIKKFYVLNVKGFDQDNLVACTLLFEGPKDEMTERHKQVVEIAKKFKGMAAGPENGMRGYLLTFLIAYTRDLASQHAVAAESFETSCAWQNVSSLCSRTKQRIYDEAAKIGFSKDKVWISFRVTQLYETGAAIYVYFTLYHKGVDSSKVVHYYEIVEDAARDEVMKSGGAISHHHGVGKIRKGFIDRTLPRMAIDWQKGIKDAIDPKNIFAINNTVYRSDEERKATQKQF